jgi:hypothetical protein
VFSHWVLDFVAHAPDLPLLLDDSPKVGLSLEYSADGELHRLRGLAVEFALLAAGLAIDRLGHRRALIARSGRGGR